MPKLVERARKGDHAAFEQLVRRHRGLIRHLVWPRLDNPADVMDVLQDTFLRAYRGLSNFRGDCSFASWIGQIATNAANSHLERQARHHPRGAGALEGGEELVAEHETPELGAARAEFWETFGACISRLPKDMRAALVLRDVEGLSYTEIASTAQCPIGTVRSRIFRARRALGERIKDRI